MPQPALADEDEEADAEEEEQPEEEQTPDEDEDEDMNADAHRANPDGTAPETADGDTEAVEEDGGGGSLLGGSTAKTLLAVGVVLGLIVLYFKYIRGGTGNQKTTTGDSGSNTVQDLDEVDPNDPSSVEDTGPNVPKPEHDPLAADEFVMDEYDIFGGGEAGED